MESGLVDLLKNTAGIISVLGARIYPLVLPEEYPVTAGAPCCTYQLITSKGETTVDGRLRFEARMQFDLWGATYADCMNAEQALLNALQGYSGTLSDNTRIATCVIEMQMARYEPDARIYRRINEFLIFY